MTITTQTQQQEQKLAKKLPRGISHYRKGYRVYVALNKQRRTGTSDTLQEAIEIKERLLKQLGQEQWEALRRSDSWTLQEGIAKTLQIVWRGKGGEATSLKNARLIEEYFGTHTLLNDIDLNVIDDFVEHCLDAKGNSGSTVNRKLSCLSRILRTAHERGKLATLPKMPKRRESEHRIRFLTEVEELQLATLLETLGNQDVTDVVLLLLYTGFRCGELWRLECRDIDLGNNTITVWKTKNRHPRTIPIVDKVLAIIERRMDSVNDVGRLLPMGSSEWLRRPWEKIRYHMNMSNDEQFVPHMLRHTCATRLSQAGVSMAIIKEWLGHSTIMTTARYAHFSPADLRNAAKLLG